MPIPRDSSPEPAPASAASARAAASELIAILVARNTELQGLAYHQARPPLVTPAAQAKRRGRVPHRVGHNLLRRFQNHAQDVLRFLHDPTVPFTNNLAEQDARMMKVKQKISGGFRSEPGAENFGIIRTLISAARKQGWDLIKPLTRAPELLIADMRFA